MTLRPGYRSLLISLMLAVGFAADSGAQDAAEMARKLQDPLANIKALMTDNDVLFDTGQDETSYSFQLQPVYAIPFEKAGFNLVNRGVFPILGMAPGSQKPIVGEPLPPGDGLAWGLGDSMLQFFFSPRNESAWKWGVGPALSLRTRTNERLSGPGWGGGPIAVLVGNIGESLSTAFIGGHVWGEEDGFSTTILQPMIFYNIPGAPGWTINYSNIIAYDWNASSGNEWTVPLGLGGSKTVATRSGLGIDYMLGYYYNVARPEGAADHIIKWAVSFLF